MEPVISRRFATVFVVLAAFVFAACGGGGDGDGDDEVVSGGQGGQQVIDADVLADARADAEEEAENDDEPEQLSTDDVADTDLDDEPPADDTTEDDDAIDVATAEEDPLDNLLNAVAGFQLCLEDDGFEFIGAPGQGGQTVADFDQDYLQALGACATETDIVSRLEEFGAAQENLTPEEIAQNNFGLPVFGECLERLGWTVPDLVPDERGALGFGTDGFGLEPPADDDSGILNTDDINQCRLEAEQYTEENFDAEAG